MQKLYRKLGSGISIYAMTSFAVVSVGDRKHQWVFTDTLSATYGDLWEHKPSQWYDAGLPEQCIKEPLSSDVVKRVMHEGMRSRSNLYVMHM